MMMTMMMMTTMTMMMIFPVIYGPNTCSALNTNLQGEITIIQQNKAGHEINGVGAAAAHYNRELGEKTDCCLKLSCIPRCVKNDM